MGRVFALHVIFDAVLESERAHRRASSQLESLAYPREALEGAYISTSEERGLSVGCLVCGAADNVDNKRLYSRGKP